MPLIPMAKHFAHYAVQWRPTGGTWSHFDLEGGSVAVFRALGPAEECRASVLADLPPGIETRIVRYHTSGYTDVAEVPDPPKETGYFDEPDPEPAKPKRHKPKPVEVID